MRRHQRTASVDADANGKAPEPSEMMVKAVAILRAANAAGHAIPQEFFDCITTDIMLDPVIAWDGHTYERGPIARWLRGAQHVADDGGDAAGFHAASEPLDAVADHQSRGEVGEAGRRGRVRRRKRARVKSDDGKSP